jgi:hypothetical protein
MNKSAFAIAGFGFAAGIVLFVVAEPLLAPRPKPTDAALVMVAKPSIPQPAAPPVERFPEVRRAITQILKDPEIR